MSPTQMALIKLGLDIAVAAGQGIAEAINAKDLVERMVAEGRDPTTEEWATLNALTDTLNAAIQAA